MHILQQPRYSENLLSVEVGEPSDAVVRDETVPRRYPGSVPGHINRPADDVFTVHDLVQRSAQLYAKRDAFGTRSVVRTHKKMPLQLSSSTTSTKNPLYELSKYSFITYREYETLVLQLGSGLGHLGLSRGSKIHFSIPTSLEWTSMFHACVSQSIPVVTAHDALGQKDFEHTIKETNPSAVLTSYSRLHTILSFITETNIKLVIVAKSLLDERTSVINTVNANSDVRIIEYDNLKHLGGIYRIEPSPPTQNDVCCIMYTSGSTGCPKGVVIKHRTLIAAVSGAVEYLQPYSRGRFSTVAYLPAAHVMELVLESSMIFMGAVLGYGSPKTLFGTCTVNCLGDVGELQPTLLIGVPQVWESVRKSAIKNLSTFNSFNKFLFTMALGWKQFMLSHHLPFASALDGIAFHRLRATMGGKLQLLINGGSRLSQATKEFFSLSLAPMVEGYGMTESCGSGMIGYPQSLAVRGIGGTIHSALDVKLRSVTQMGYSVNEYPPNGEIMLKGEAVFDGYYNNAEETSKVLTEDGWLKTGDIGEFDDYGGLRIIDRLKNLIKLSNGEYIAVEELESVYRSSSLITNIMIYANSELARPLAIVTPQMEYLEAKADETGFDCKEAVRHPAVVEKLLSDLKMIGKVSGLAKHQIVTAAILSATDWTSANGFLTAAQKLNRPLIYNEFRAEIQRLCATQDRAS